MLIRRQVPKFFWTEAAHTVVQLLNSLPKKSNNGTTLDKKFSGIKPDLSNHRIFGCLSFIHLDKIRWDILSSQSTLGIYLGIDEAAKAYCVYILALRKVQITYDMVFDEQRFLTTKPEDSTFALKSLFPLIPEKQTLANPSNIGLDNTDLESESL